MGPGEVIAMMTLFVSVAATIVLRGPLGKALADRIAGRAARAPDTELTGELDRTQSELDALKQRLAEVEERQDFAERLLSQQGEGPRVGLPGRGR
jgi:hypothetical protein